MTAVPALDRRSDYVSAVAVELADLAPDDRAELIEELDDHIAALLEDRPDADVVGELGTPRAYASELRAAAGLTGDRPARPSWRELAATALRQLDRRVPDGLRPFLAALRPVWWVFRGYVVFAAGCHAVGASWSTSGLGVLVPAPGGVWELGVVGAVVVAAASVWLGTRAPRSIRQRVGVLLLDALAVVAALVVAGGARYGVESEIAYDTQYVPNCPIELSNLYGYDAAGRPLQDVRLFDQNGNPFDLSVFACGAGQFAPGAGGTNSYPWPSATYGEAQEPTGPPSSLTPLPGATVPAPSPSASGTPTPTGTR